MRPPDTRTRTHTHSHSLPLPFCLYTQSPPPFSALLPPPPLFLTPNMPRLDDSTHQILQDAEQGIRRRTVDAWDSFSNFALRDNVLEVAVGLM